MIFQLFYACLYSLLALLIIYFIRHFRFTLNRAFNPQKEMYLQIEDDALPTVTILVPAHNEEKVIGDALLALLKQDYPASRFKIMPLNDRSTDSTKEIIDQYALQYPEQIFPYHRASGKPGKSAALKEVCANLPQI